MEEKKKVFTKAELITVIVAIVLVIACIVTSVIIICKKNGEVASINQQLNDLKTKVDGITITPGITAEEVNKAIADAIKEIKIPGEGLSEEQVKTIVQTAINGITIPEGGLTEAEVKVIIDAAIAEIEDSEGGITKKQVQAIVDAAIKEIKLPESGLSEKQVQAIVDAAIKGIKLPESGLTEAQVKKIVSDALKNIDTGLTAEEVKEIVSEAIKEAFADFDLKEALQSGGSYILTEDTVLEDVIIPEGIVSSLNLRGFTLTVRGAWEIYGDLTFEGGDIVIELPEDEDENHEFPGISVGSDELAAGTLILENVTVEGNRLWNIDNYSKAYLTDVIFIVNAGYGVSNYCDGVIEIEGCTFVSNGDAASPIYSLGGVMTITDCEFIEGSQFEDYAYRAPIEAYAGEIILDDVTVTTSTRYSVFASTNGKVTIISGDFNSKFLLVGDRNTASITIIDGTIAGIDFANITKDSAIFEGFNFELIEDEDRWLIIRSK